jgi:hypothetical protein
VDLVGTCPKNFWREWIAEGDVAGDPETGEEWGWYTRDPLALAGSYGDRFYIVAWGRLRGFAIITRVVCQRHKGWIVCRKGNAVACTIDKAIPGFRGLRKRWWGLEEEKPFPNWKDI